MKRMTKYIIIILAALLLVPSPGSGSARAAGSQQIMVDHRTGFAGTTVEVPISLHSEGRVTAVQLLLSYDRRALELAEVKKGSGLQPAFSVLSNIGNGKIVIGSLGFIIGSGTQEIAVAVFRIKADAPPGRYEVQLVEVLFSDGDANNVTNQFQVVDGYVSVQAKNGPTPTPIPSPEPTDIPAESLPEEEGDDVVVIVNGQAEAAGKAITTTEDGRRVATIVLDAEKLEARLAAAADGAMAVIPVGVESNAVIGVLEGSTVQLMARKQGSIQVLTDTAMYTLPVWQLNWDQLRKQLGENVKAEEIKLQIEIAAPPADMMRKAAASAANGGFSLLAPPVSFAVKVIYGNATVEIARFDTYTERAIAIPSDVDPADVATGVVIGPDGAVRHVPTRIEVMDGRYYALMSSMTNSVYAIIRHPQTFKDVENHWAQRIVNDMGSRMIINGSRNGLFRPDDPITRAEFAAIIVRGLGLEQESGITAFSDVSAEEWHSHAIHTAYTHRLIYGFADRTFRPADRITREQAMAIIARAAEMTGLEQQLPPEQAELWLQPFADADSVSAWAKSSIATVLQAGIVTGRNSTKLAPQANITRAEVAAMVRRLLEKSQLI